MLLYWKDVDSTGFWGSTANWFEDAAATVNHGALPASGDSCTYADGETEQVIINVTVDLGTGVCDFPSILVASAEEGCGLGTINGGTFTGSAWLMTGVINGGTFTGSNWFMTGVINGGTFTGSDWFMTGVINGGTFTASDFVNGGQIYAGNFPGAGFTNQGTLYGGTYTGTGWINYGLSLFAIVDGDGWVNYSTYYGGLAGGIVTGASGTNAGVISDGIYTRYFDNTSAPGTIAGGLWLEEGSAVTAAGLLLHGTSDPNPGFANTLSVPAVFPPDSDVLTGNTYGPTGVENVGTYDTNAPYTLGTAAQSASDVAAVTAHSGAISTLVTILGIGGGLNVAALASASYNAGYVAGSAAGSGGGAIHMAI